MKRQTLAVTLVALAALGARADKQPSSPPQVPPRDSAAVAAGGKLFAQYCQPCHGTSGKGDGPAASALKPKPRDFTKPQELKSRNDEDLFRVISKGGPALKLSPLMVGWGNTLKEPQIRQLIAFVRSLGDSAADSAKAVPKREDEKAKK